MSLPKPEKVGRWRWEAEALAEVRSWAASGARFPDTFRAEFGFDVGPETRGRQDAYRAVLSIIDRWEARAFHQRHPYTCANCTGEWWTRGAYLDHFARLDLPLGHPSEPPKPPDPR